MRRINDQCVEVGAFANSLLSADAQFLGFSVLLAISGIELLWFGMSGAELSPEPPLTGEDWLMILVLPWIIVVLALISYFLRGVGRSRGIFIRINRRTRKIYYMMPKEAHMHVLEWDSIEAMGGYAPMISASGYTSFNPLYLIGVDYTMKSPTEVLISSER